MAKFSRNRPVPRPRAAIQAAGRAVTHEGAAGYSRDAESDLFLLSAANFVGEETYYERASARDARYRALVHAVTQSNPRFIAGTEPVAFAGDPTQTAGLAHYLRNVMLMRSASLVLAAEYVAAGGANGRRVVNAVLQRPDEPAELLSYWFTHHGRNIPMPIKRGVADAVTRLYTQRAALKYDSQSHAMRMGDVIELVHPVAKDRQQNHLFRYLLDVGHNRENPRLATELDILRTERMLRAMPEETRRAYARRFSHVLEEAGYTWERLSQWLPGGMDAEAWESIIPAMKPMALIRNLRNFDQVGISQRTVNNIITRITDPASVRYSRIFPYHCWSAYKNAPSDSWKRALGQMLELTTQNIPELPGGTLVLIDTSGSMQSALSNRGTIERYEVAALMAAATAKRNPGTTVVIYGNTSRDITGQLLGRSALGIVDLVHQNLGIVGHGTFGNTAIARHFSPNKHRRAIIFTDDQQMDDAEQVRHVPMIFTFDLGGYAVASQRAGQPGRYTVAGFTDALFSAIPVLESGRDQAWPF